MFRESRKANEGRSEIKRKKGKGQSGKNIYSKDEKQKVSMPLTTNEILKIQHRCRVRKWKQKQENDARNYSTQRSIRV